MLLQFPNDFFWGTSTAAAQIETASNHSFKGMKSHDGHIFDRTADHELRRDEDVEHIARFGSVYRCSVDWARLQTEPFGEFHYNVVTEYRHFFKKLAEKDVQIMFVLHHFANPKWFEERGGWLYEENAACYTDFVKKCIHHFGRHVSMWNTFNEPNVYALNAYALGKFPPFRKRWGQANEVLRNMSIAHNTATTMLKSYDKTKPIGISLNTGHFRGTNPLGAIVAKGFDRWFINQTAKLFEKCDFWGISYYAHVPFNPRPMTMLTHADKLKAMDMPHDKMWAYNPEGLGKILRRFHKKYGKPIIVTENGICTDDSRQRIQAIKDYLRVIHEAIRDDVHVLGYIHWSTFDNFEWDLGPTFRFGLLRTNPQTRDREDTEAARFYEDVTQKNAVNV